MAFGGADLFFDQIKIIQQPLPGGRDPVICGHFGGQQRTNLGQDALILGQPGQQQIRGLVGRQAMGSRQPPAMLFHLVCAEQFRPQRRFVGDKAAHGMVPAREKPCFQQWPDFTNPHENLRPYGVMESQAGINTNPHGLNPQ